MHRDYYQYLILFKVEWFVNCNDEVVFNLMIFDCYAFFAPFCCRVIMLCYAIVLHHLYHW